MKKNLLYVLAFMASVTFFTGCSDDDDNSWKEIPSTEIKGENATLTVNGQSVTGSVQLQAKNGEQGVLKLNNIVNGYDNVDIDVALVKQPDESFNFSGETTLSNTATKTPANDLSVTTTINVSGNITMLGKVTVEVSTEMTGGLVGTWILPDTAIMDKDVKYILTSPVLINWPAADQDPNSELKSGEQLARVAGLVGPFALIEVLNQVTFNSNGNITAKYYPTIVLGEGEDIQSWMMGKIFGGEMKFVPSSRQWLDSPANLASWYIKEDKLYVIPNLSEILKQISKDNNGNSDFSAIFAMLETLKETDDATLKEMVVGLGEKYGLDLSKLEAAQIKEVLGWLTTGIPLKYKAVDGLLYIYVDKAMVTPFMPVIFSLLPKLQAEFDKLAVENPMMGLLPVFLGVEKFTDFETIWKTNTNVFELGIMLKK